MVVYVYIYISMYIDSQVELHCCKKKNVFTPKISVVLSMDVNEAVDTKKRYIRI